MSIVDHSNSVCALVLFIILIYSCFFSLILLLVLIVLCRFSLSRDAVHSLLSSNKKKYQIVSSKLNHRLLPIHLSNYFSMHESHILINRVQRAAFFSVLIIHDKLVFHLDRGMHRDQYFDCF